MCLCMRALQKVYRKLELKDPLIWYKRLQKSMPNYLIICIFYELVEVPSHNPLLLSVIMTHEYEILHIYLDYANGQKKKDFTDVTKVPHQPTWSSLKGKMFFIGPI